MRIKDAWKMSHKTNRISQEKQTDALNGERRCKPREMQLKLPF